MPVEKLLLSLHAQPSRVGFLQLVTAIEYVLQHPETTSITQEIYPAVAKAYGTSPACIDHNLRRVIRDVWRYADRRRLAALFPNPDLFRPSNKAFIFAIASHIRLRRRAQWPPPSPDAPCGEPPAPP